MKKHLILQLVNHLKNKWSAKDDTPTKFIKKIAENEVYSRLISVYSTIDLFIVGMLIKALNEGRDIEDEYVLIKSNIFSFSTVTIDEFNPEVDCDDCDGSGERTCNQCNNGSIACDECDGEGDIECNSCEGTGYEHECGACEGTGYESCDDCDGDGVDDENETCSSCGGKGNQECGDCDGTGNETCSDCGGSGKNNCTWCGGDGRISCDFCDGSGDQPCYECDGSGKVVVNDKVAITQKYYVSYDLNIKSILNEYPELDLIPKNLELKIINSDKTFLTDENSGLMEEYNIDNPLIDTLYFGEFDYGLPTLRYWDYYSKGRKVEVLNLTDFFE